MAHETRRQARTRITTELMTAARRQLAEVGAAGLSLREVAREIGMVSSAVYRYVDSRDDLLTRLIIESYDALGSTAELASAAAGRESPGDDLTRWIATVHAIRRWAIENPHEYLLLYGSPVPGYAAPDDTVGPGTRVIFALVGILSDAAEAGRLDAPTGIVERIPAELATELDALAAATLGEVSADTVLAFIAAWTQIFGLISFEIANQTRGMVTEHRALFDATTRRLAGQIGLRGGSMGT